MKNASRLRAAKTQSQPPQSARRHGRDEAIEANLYRTLVEKSDRVIFTMHRSGRLLFVNAAAAKNFNMRPEQLVGQNLWKFFPRSMSRLYRANTRKVLETMRPLTVADPTVLLGRRRWMRITIQPLANPRTGQFDRVMVMGGDITELKEAELAARRSEQALRESEQHLRGILEASRDVIYRLDIATLKHDYFSPSSQAILGFSAKELQRMGPLNYLARIHPEDRILAKPLHDFATNASQAALPDQPLLYRFKTKGGQYRWLSTARAVQRNAAGVPLAIIGTIRDVTEQKQAEIRLTQSEANYRSLVENLRAAIFTVDSKGKILFSNAASAAMMGVTPAQLTGRNFFKLFPAAASRRYRSYLRRVFQSDQALYVVEQAVRREKRLWFDVSLQPLHDAATARPNAVMVVARDISERREAELAAQQAQQALADSERRFRGILEASQDVMCRLDLKTLKYDFVSPACLDILGYEPQEVHDFGFHGWVRRVHPEDRHLVSPILNRADKDPIVSQQLQYRFRTKSGQYRWLDVGRVIQRDARGHPATMIGTVRDITEMREAELATRRSQQALADSERSIRGILEASHDMIYRIDLKTLKYNFISPACLDILGYDPQEVRALGCFHGWLSRVHPEDRHLVLPIWNRAEKDPARIQRLEYRFRTKSGQYRWLSSSRTTQRDARGHPLAMVGTVRDITELREAELAARQAQHQGMVARDQERRRLAADLHDSLGQGLVLLRLKLQRTLEDGAGALDEAQMRELADTIRTCGQLVQEVRGLCQGLYPPTLESLGLPAALRGLARDFAGSADVTIDCPAHLENQRLKGEQEIALFRIAQEALQNAVRHGRAHHVQVRLTRRHGQVRMCVSDDGAGFDTRQMSKGLGLRVMAERAKSLGGQLTVGSEKRNTRVCVEIPLGGQVRSKNKENTKITKITKDTKKARKRRKLTTGKE